MAWIKAPEATVARFEEALPPGPPVARASCSAIPV